jgi:hypothetical protein
MEKRTSRILSCLVVHFRRPSVSSHRPGLSLNFSRTLLLHELAKLGRKDCGDGKRLKTSRRGGQSAGRFAKLALLYLTRHQRDELDDYASAVTSESLVRCTGQGETP